MVNSSIFQSDFLSPLLFCLALFALTSLMNKTQYGYKIKKKKINHLFYIDDIKLYRSNDDELEALINSKGV